MHAFLNQVFSLRHEILPLIDRLLQENNNAKLAQCFTIMEQEQRQAPHLLQRRIGGANSGIGERLQRFYVEDGQLDQLQGLIGSSVLKVWQKLRSHLRELERKNNRIEDLRSRIGEIARLPEGAVPQKFLQIFLAPAHMYGDLHYWDTAQKAEPPLPRRRVSKKERIGRVYLRDKVRSEGPVQSMDEAKLAAMALWLDRQFGHDDQERFKISRGKIDGFPDFAKVMELAESGLLNSGRRLARIDFQLSGNSDHVVLTAGKQRLALHDLLVEKIAKGKG